MTGNKTNMLTVSVTKARIGQMYRCVLTGIDGNMLTSDAASIIAADDALDTPVEDLLPEEAIIEVKLLETEAEITEDAKEALVEEITSEEEELEVVPEENENVEESESDDENELSDTVTEPVLSGEVIEN
jgi:hypothetical protein